MDAQPSLLMIPDTVAVVAAGILVPVVTVGAVLIPEPIAATAKLVTPPPVNKISPLYDCTAVGVNFT